MLWRCKHKDMTQCHQSADNIACHMQCSFTEHRNMKVVYRRYASLFFLVGIDDEEASMLLPCALSLEKMSRKLASALSQSLVWPAASLLRELQWQLDCTLA